MHGLHVFLVLHLAQAGPRFNLPTLKRLKHFLHATDTPVDDVPK